MNRSLFVPFVLIVAGLCGNLRAEAPCCESCGCQPCTKKICRLVCEEKEQVKKVYCCKCEDFCVPGRSIACKKPCDCHWWCCLCCDHYTYKPTCGCVRTRVVPVITEEKKKVPAYKCVVEEVCTRCGHCAKKLDYPSAEDAETALAMVREPGIEHVTGNAPVMASAPAQQPVSPVQETVQQASAAVPAEVASRSFVDRLFSR